MFSGYSSRGRNYLDQGTQGYQGSPVDAMIHSTNDAGGPRSSHTSQDKAKDFPKHAPYTIQSGSQTVCSMPAPAGVITFLHARPLLEKGCLSYLAHIHDLTKNLSSLEATRVVREFMDVFPINLLGVPLDRDIDFVIELDWGTKPISSTSKRIVA
ncbi:hypothetical protein MTR67_035451 [Solanum verrucosum]|uniref:Reverse transcriptase n=1 Tax=Solanum verrucosum TaxID=315347 RepID=A0AAF0UAD4_SOLVR|nr:hypothetical protein MTR67_035451 [Solanum verrucosum]